MSPQRLAAQRGMTLIELMVALVLGLIVAGGAISMFVANKQTFQLTESLARLQENARVSFEIMARDVREAGGNPCEEGLPIANVLDTPSSNWWSNYGAGVLGYDNTATAPGLSAGSAVAQRVAGTDVLDVFVGTQGSVSVIDHQPTSAQFKVNTKDHGIQDGDIVMVCDFDHAAILQVTNAQPGTNNTVVHNTGGSASPGNCTKGLGLPVKCDANGTSYTYGPNSTIARLQARRWFVGNNANGGRSLYQTVLRNNKGTLSTDALEIAEGINDMQLTYLQPGGSDYVAAGSVTDWKEVQAVRIEFTLVPPAGASTGNSNLVRTIEHTVTLRNHAP